MRDLSRIQSSSEAQWSCNYIPLPLKEPSTGSIGSRRNLHQWQMNIAFIEQTFTPVTKKYTLYSRNIHFIEQTFTPRAFNWANRIKEEFAPVNIERNETFGDKYLFMYTCTSIKEMSVSSFSSVWSNMFPICFLDFQILDAHTQMWWSRNCLVLEANIWPNIWVLARGRFAKPQMMNLIVLFIL